MKLTPWSSTALVFSANAVIPECSSILKWDDIFGLSTPEPSDSTFCAQGDRNGKAVTVASKVIAGDKQMSSLVFDLKNCTILSKKGDSQGRCSLREINYREDYNYNFFSLTCMLRGGCSIHRNAKAIKTKTGETLAFNININTTNQFLASDYINNLVELCTACGCNIHAWTLQHPLSTGQGGRRSKR